MHELSPRRTGLCLAARGYLGTRWRHQGRNIAGMDCVGLLIAAGRDVGLLAPTFNITGYPRRPNPTEFLSRFYEFMRPLDTVMDVKVGDVLVVAIGPVLSHTGIVCTGERGYTTFIHAETRRRSVVEDPVSLWIGKARGAFSYRDIDS